MEFMDVLKCWSPFNFGKDCNRDNELVYVAFDMVLDTHLVLWSLVVCIDAIRKRSQKFGLKYFFVGGVRELWMCVKLTDTEGSKL